MPRIQKKQPDTDFSSDVSWMSIDALAAWDRNPRLNDENVPRVAGSIRKFGFVAPVVVWQGKDRLVAGHTRLKAMRLLLADDPAFVPKGAPGIGVVPVLSHPFNNEEEANAYAIADNRLNELSAWDDRALVGLLQEIDALKGFDISLTGFEQADFEALVASLEMPNFGDDGLPDELPDFGELDHDDRTIAVLVVFDPTDEKQHAAMCSRMGVTPNHDFRNKRTFHVRDIGWMDE